MGISKEEMAAWEKDERVKLEKMKVPDLKAELKSLDEETFKRCKGYKKDMLVLEVLTLRRDAKRLASFGDGPEPAAKRQKVSV